MKQTKEVVVNCDGEYVYLEDKHTRKYLEWDIWCEGDTKEQILAVAEDNPEYKDYIVKHLENLTKDVEELRTALAREAAEAELERCRATMYQGGGLGGDEADSRMWSRIASLEHALGYDHED